MNKWTLIILLLFVALACKDNKKMPNAAAEESPELPQEVSMPLEDNIPRFDYAGLEDKYLRENAGVTYVINFWATWCKPCIKEIPAFEEIQSKYEDQRVEVVLVSLDFPEKWFTAVIPFIKKHQIQSDVILLDDPDANTWISKISQEWSGAIPATLIIKDGTSKFYEQSFTYEELETELKTIL